MRTITFVTAILSVTISAIPSHAETWRCQFPGFNEPTYFVETSDGVWKIVGNNGSGDVWIIKGKKVISFVEPVPSGAVMTTTIFIPTGEAVHSRNTVMTILDEDPPPAFSVSQVMGTCVVRPG